MMMYNFSKIGDNIKKFFTPSNKIEWVALGVIVLVVVGVFIFFAV